MILPAYKSMKQSHSCPSSHHSTLAGNIPETSSLHTHLIDNMLYTLVLASILAIAGAQVQTGTCQVFIEEGAPFGMISLHPKSQQWTRSDHASRYLRVHYWWLKHHTDSILRAEQRTLKYSMIWTQHALTM